MRTPRAGPTGISPLLRGASDGRASSGAGGRSFQLTAGAGEVQLLPHPWEFIIAGLGPAKSGSASRAEPERIALRTWRELVARLGLPGPATDAPSR